MATKRSNSTRRRKKNSKKTGTGALGLLIQWIGAVRSDPESREQLRRVSGWSLIFLCVLTLLACFSYFYHGRADQSVIEGEMADGSVVRNMLGQLGAYLADFIVHKGFGLFGFVVPLYGIFLGLVLLEDDYYFYARRVLKYVLFSIFWGSMFLSFIVELMYDRMAEPQYLDLGGGVGYTLNHILYQYIGKLGVAFLMLFSALLFFVVNFKAEMKASKLINTMSQRIKQQKGANLGKLIENAKDKVRPASASSAKKKKPAANKPVTAKTGTADTDSVSDTTSTQDAIPLNAEGDGQQIELNIPGPQVIKPKSKPKIDKENLEFTIEDPEEEEMVVQPEAKKFEQIGEDNVGYVVGTEDRVEKIVPIEDQETALNDELIDWEEFDPTKELSDYEPPKLELMEDHGSGGNREVSRTELENNKNKIVETLNHYGIEITNIKASVGPTVTLYEIVPAPGVRISKIRNLEDDIALSLAALGIRIIAPIPGKGTIGIEVPNSNPEVVSLRGVLSTVKFQTTKAELPIAIGRTISNKVYIGDLNKMPHLLIAGATGQGKSVGLNTIIASLLYKKHPAEVKFVLIDPKKVEMSLYQSLNLHFLAVMPEQNEPIITDVKDAVAVLKSLCIEMDQRYDLLKKARVRNLKEYNAKFTSRKLNPRKGHKYLPYIVLVIDELADMMMVAGKEVEMPIARLAQLARAVGIHLVVATQRPSVNVITGIIKANFPARMSYRVTSKVDSRTILDANGADQLIGRGDLLLSTGSDLIRVQNAFIDTPEVERLVDFIADQRGFTEPYYLPDALQDEEGADRDDEPFEKDPKFAEAARLIVLSRIGSASLIQRKLKLGYNRAGRIIDQLERANIVGPHSGSKPREVLISSEEELERYLETL